MKGREGRESEGVTKCQKKTSWGDGYFHYLDCGAGGFMVLSIYKKTELYNLNMYILVYTNDTSVKLL